MSHHHHHHHGHHGQEHEHKSLADRNEEHFNNHGESAFSEEWIIKAGEQITSELQSDFEWLGVSSSASMLDYACGTGLITKTFSATVSNICGMDVSGVMVKAYNAANAPHRATKTDLTVSPSSTLYDFIFISLALHHIEDPAGLIRNLAQSLRPNGVVVTLDWTDGDNADLTQMPLKHIVSRSGFSQKEMAEMYAEAGLDCTWRLFDKPCSTPIGDKRAFLARGQLKA